MSAYERGNHLADDAGQQIGGVFPSDQVETLEALVDEIKRVSGIGIDAVGLGSGEQGSARTAGRVPMEMAVRTVRSAAS